MINSDNTSKPSQSGATVAIIDPDPSIRDSLQLLLDSVNVNATIYSSAEDFLAQLDKQSYACLITETSLPGIGGFELLERLGKLDQGIPTIMLSRQSDVSMAVHAIHAGAVDFIEKPFIQPVLLRRIRQILSGDTSMGQLGHCPSFK